MVRIAVYGTLRQGKRLHWYLEGEEFLGEDWLEGFDLYFDGLPYAVRGEGRLKVEVYEVNDEVFDDINGLEVGAGYTPVEVETKFGPAILWEWQLRVNGEKIEGGDFETLNL